MFPTMLRISCETKLVDPTCAGMTGFGKYEIDEDKREECSASKAELRDPP